MSDSAGSAEFKGSPAEKPTPSQYGQALLEPAMLILLAVFIALYWRAWSEMLKVWRLVDSYYSHGFLVPIISLFFVWAKRVQLAKALRRPCVGGYAWIVASGLILLLGDFLGFRVFMQISMIPMIAGLCLVIQGKERTKILWFPLVYLIFMIPIPPSVTQSFALQLKLLATQCAVSTARLFTLPMVREGSYVYWSHGGASDYLLIGDVCGGLRSLIALLAFGALMAYISKTKPWGRTVILLLSGPIAVVSNIFRIFMLCVVGYFSGSRVAAGTFHDVSGYLIFIVAFMLFFALEKQLRRLAPQKDNTP